jgi:hypothetical protein
VIVDVEAQQLILPEGERVPFPACCLRSAGAQRTTMVDPVRAIRGAAKVTFRLEQSDFTAWLERYRQAWESRDPVRAAEIFAADASYRETPFDPPMRGRAEIEDYWAKAVAGQKDVRFTYEVIACAQDQGICRWHAAFTGVPGGEAIDLDGIFRCRFADPAQVATFDEWWHIKVVPATEQGGG